MNKTINYQFINPYDIIPFANSRKSIAKGSMKELADSFKVLGQQQAILVRHNPHKKDGFTLIYGHRRLEAALSLSTKEKPYLVKAEIREVDDNDVFELQGIENLQRVDLPPLDEAALFQQLLGKKDYTTKILSDKIGKSEIYIIKRISLNKLIKPIQEALQKEEITLSHALILAKYVPVVQESYFKAIFSEYNFEKLTANYKRTTPLTPKQLLKLIEEKTDYNLTKAIFNIKDPTLLKGVPSCVECPKNSTNDIGLFEGIKKNVCTDFSCRTLKEAAHLSNLSSRNNKAVFIESDYYSNTRIKGLKDVLKHDSYKDSKEKGCPDTEPAIIAAANKEESLGKMVYICRNQKCKIHNSNSSSGHIGSGKSPAQKAKEAKSRLDNKYRLALLTAISEEFLRHCTTNKLYQNKPDEHLIIIAKKMYGRIEYNEQKKFAKWFGLLTTKTDARGITAVNKVLDSAVTEAGVRQMLFVLSLFRETETISWSLTKYDTIKAMVKKYRINDKAILKAIAATVKKPKVKPVKVKKLKSKKKAA